MTVKECYEKLDKLNYLYDNFIVYADEHKLEDIAPLLHDVCIALYEYKNFFGISLQETNANIFLKNIHLYASKFFE